MKVSELPYERVTIEEVKEKLPQLVERIRSAKSERLARFHALYHQHGRRVLRGRE